MKKVWMVFMMCLVVLTARAELKIDIAGAGTNPIPIAIPVFAGDTGEEITTIIRNDLQNSGLFRLVDPNAYIQKMNGVNTTPRFADWQAIKAEALVQGEVTHQPDGRIKVAFRLWDVFAGQSMEGKALTLAAQDKRRLGHMAADMIYGRITGETGYFDSKIVYVAETGPHQKRVKRLAMMDQDGANHRYLTNGQTMVLTPRFSPDMQKIAYLSYKGGRPGVYLMDVVSGKEETIGYFPGMTFAPRFSPDRRSLLMSFSEKGNTEIYLYDIASKDKKRLTYHPMIDTSPSFSPDGSQIVFNSDRSGSAQLYVMDKNGKNAKRISLGKGTYSTPVWSPRGDYIAFTKIQDGEFYIGLMRPDGSAERLIAKGFLVEGPTWAPNGRVLMYFKQNPYSSYGEGGQTGLYSIDVTGRYERKIPTPVDGSDPAWSPLLH